MWLFAPVFALSRGVKKLIVLLSICGVLISACMVFLVVRGVSLRTAPLIRPSVISGDDHVIARAVASRLFAEWQSNDLILVGTPLPSEWSERIATLMKDEIRVVSKKALSEPPPGSAPNLCTDLCWLTVPSEQALDLAPGEFIKTAVQTDGRPFITLHFIEFSGYEHDIVDECEREQRLDFRCLRTLAIKESRRKMKDPTKRYFFMRKYNHRDYFLFLQTKSEAESGGL